MPNFATASATSSTELIKIFEARSWRLRAISYVFLLVSAVLILLGGYVVLNAQILTSNDINHGLDERKKATEEEYAKLQSQSSEIGRQIGSMSPHCMSELNRAVRPWIVSDQGFNEADPPALRIDVGGNNSVPDGPSMAAAIATALRGKSDNDEVKLIIAIPVCGGSSPHFDMAVKKFDEVIASLNKFEFMEFNRDEYNKDLQLSNQIGIKLNFLGNVLAEISKQQVVAQSTGGGGDDFNRSADTTIVRLVQTSITRFGLLAVIGFFVSLLVSLYKYNVRLAAFYTAKADIFRLRTKAIVVSELSLLAGVLTPQLEFGKTPASPADQMISLIGALKGLENK